MSHPDTPAPAVNIEGEGTLMARFVTSAGNIEAELYEHRTPRTVANFVALATGAVEWTKPGGGKTSEPLYSMLRRISVVMTKHDASTFTLTSPVIRPTSSNCGQPAILVGVASHRRRGRAACCTSGLHGAPRCRPWRTPVAPAPPLSASPCHSAYAKVSKMLLDVPGKTA